MKVEIVKVIVLLALFVMTFILGVLPVIMIKMFKKSRDLHRKRIYKLTLSFLSCYAAGVFLGTALLDILPDVRSDLATAFDAMNVSPHFPVAEAVMMGGLFLILLVEQIVLTVKERNPHMYSNELVEEPNTQASLVSGSQNKVMSHGATFEPNTQTSLLSGSQNKVRNHGATASFTNSDGGQQHLHITHSTKVDHSHHSDLERSHSIISDGEDNEESAVTVDINPAHAHSSLRSLLLILAISLHSVFEGLAVGLQKSSDEVLGIFAALAVHKSILSFSLGMNLIQSKLSHGGILKSILFFSLASPVGIGIGIGIINLWDSEQSTLAQGILSGIACGTFLYVTFFEVLPSQFDHRDHRLSKVFFLLLGFITTVGIVFLHSDDDD